MNFIRLEETIRNSNTIKFRFCVSPDLATYIEGDVLSVTYEQNLEDVPDSVLNVVFAANFLPFAWVVDARIVMPEIDEDFYNCIPFVERGYRKMYSNWRGFGGLECNNIVKSPTHSEPRSAAFFSGGLDAVHTMLSHLNEKPDLLSVWGSDIAYTNEDGWLHKKGHIETICAKVNLHNITIRSNFRLLEEERALGKVTLPLLGDGWWHGIKHSISLLGMAAPLAYQNKYTTVYIASSFPRDDTRIITCASNCYSDNEVRFCGCRIVYDDIGLDRQGKTRHVIEMCRQRKLKLDMHVCWKSPSGDNCCQCEKCMRTITGILAEGADPAEFGFNNYVKFYNFNNVVRGIVDLINNQKRSHSFVRPEQLNSTQKRLIENWPYLKKSRHRHIFMWIMRQDFLGETLLCLPISIRIVNKSKRVLSILKHRIWK